jgi:hypothetical protein
MVIDQLERYGDLVAAVSEQARCFGEDGVAAESAAKVIARAAAAYRPRTRYTIGRDAAILVRLARVLSDRFLDRVVRRNLRSHYAANAQYGLPATRKHNLLCCATLWDPRGSV